MNSSSPTALRHACCARSHLLKRSLFGEVCRTREMQEWAARTLEVCWTGSTANQPRAARALTCTSDLSGVMDLELAHWRPLHPAGMAGGQAERRRGGASAHWRSGAAVWRFLFHLTAWHAGTCLPQCFCDVFRSRNVTSLMPSVSVTEPRTRVPPSEPARST